LFLEPFFKRGELMRLRALLLLLLISVGLAGCMQQAAAPAAGATAPSLAGDPAHPAHGQGWVETRLYFGLGPADAPDKGVSEADWREFLDKEVTPRFPDGLSVLDVYGQWQGKGEAAPERLRSKMLIIDYPDGPEIRAKIDAIRAAWKHKTGDQSVLMATTPAEVSF
jgi:hypothetical protein